MWTTHPVFFIAVKLSFNNLVSKLYATARYHSLIKRKLYTHETKSTAFKIFKGIETGFLSDMNISVWVHILSSLLN